MTLNLALALRAETQMIRVMREQDLDSAVAIWLTASIKAHSFVAEEFWQSQQQNMRDVYLPHSESWVYEDNGHILGFISYYEGSIPAIFVDPQSQSNGIGTQLLDTVKNQYEQLTLTVYAENEKTHQFYLRHGFSDVGKCICEHTGQKQLEMRWIRA
ncbi:MULTISPECIES: N-acetyltransferase [Shewanella]|uniref:N-acetyltransferase n=1 Tax=Shewanella TaxID=22 RepID=UPI0006E667AA|nr:MULTISPECIES: N-acetyltransferase [Shewanella]KPZ72260.1 putative N-acetyltransferase YjaB [Shewanella sp. P1-14-1]